MGVITTVDHVKVAISRLCSQFADKPKIVAWLTAMIGPAVPIESTLLAILAAQSITSSAGVQLDRIGRLIGLARNGLSDLDYQRALFAWVAVESSKGTPESLISVASLLLTGTVSQVVSTNGVVTPVQIVVETTNGPGGTVVIRILNAIVGDALANTLWEFLQHAAAAGVRVILETQYVPDTAEWMFAYSAFLTIPASAGGSSLTVGGADSNFPASGVLVIDAGLAVQETVTYTAFIGPPWHFVLSAPLVNSHSNQACVQLATGPGLGMGDTANSSTGGQLASARSAYYTGTLSLDDDFWISPAPKPIAPYQSLPLIGRSGNFRED